MAGSVILRRRQPHKSTQPNSASARDHILRLADQRDATKGRTSPAAMTNDSDPGASWISFSRAASIELWLPDPAGGHRHDEARRLAKQSGGKMPAGQARDRPGPGRGVNVGHPGRVRLVAGEEVHRLVLCAPFTGNGTVVPSQAAIRALTKIPGARLVLYPDAGHAFLFQEGATFAFQIESFLAGGPRPLSVSSMRQQFLAGEASVSAAGKPWDSRLKALHSDATSAQVTRVDQPFASTLTKFDNQQPRRKPPRLLKQQPPHCERPSGFRPCTERIPVR